MKKIMISLLFTMTLSLGLALPTFAVTDSILIYGEKLTESQRVEVRESLGISENDAVEEHDVTGQDYANFIKGNPNANMYSSALIDMTGSSDGLVVNIVTPENITKVTSEMYMNALLTAGAENVTVDVTSPVTVTGHSALTGIYKAYDVEGIELDQDRMEIANDELVVATDLAETEGVTDEDVGTLLTEIKQMISEQNPVTREEVEAIIDEKLSQLEINLSEADRQKLIDLFNRMRELDIDFSGVQEQLKTIASDLADRAEELGLDQGFWDKVVTFFTDMFNSIGNFFKNSGN